MVNLRMLGLASALFLLFPVGVAADDAWTILQGGAEVVAEVTDVVIAEIDQVSYEKEYDRSSFFTGEQLVEGHTVFATIDLKANYTPRFADNGTINATGFVECRHEAELEGPRLGPLTIPNRIKRLYAECRVGETVIASPDPFQPSSAPTAAPNEVGPMGPTGRLIPLETPSGKRGYVEELTYTETWYDADGRAHPLTRYAWRIPVFDPWLDLKDGHARNFWAPIPTDRLREMGVESLHFAPEPR